MASLDFCLSARDIGFPSGNFFVDIKTGDFDPERKKHVIHPEASYPAGNLQKESPWRRCEFCLKHLRIANIPNNYPEEK